MHALFFPFDEVMLVGGAMTDGEAFKQMPESLRVSVRDSGGIYYHVLRFGFEYAFDVGCPKIEEGECFVAVRFGAWHDSDHKMTFTGEPGLDVNTRSQAIQFLGGEEDTHVTAGLAFLFNNRFDLNAAVDFSDAVNTVSLSATVHFGGGS